MVSEKGLTPLLSIRYDPKHEGREVGREVVRFGSGIGDRAGGLCAHAVGSSRRAHLRSLWKTFSSFRFGIFLRLAVGARRPICTGGRHCKSDCARVKFICSLLCQVRIVKWVDMGFESRKQTSRAGNLRLLAGCAAQWFKGGEGFRVALTGRCMSGRSHQGRGFGSARALPGAHRRRWPPHAPCGHDCAIMRRLIGSFHRNKTNFSW